MFEKQSTENQKAPKAGRTAKGAGIACVGANATGVSYSRFCLSDKRHVVHASGPAGAFMVAGQVGKALSALVKAGAAGVTALEVSSWAYRLGAYVHTLRHDFGLEIETCREPHEGGWHARYVLHSPVSIAEDEA